MTATTTTCVDCVERPHARGLCDRHYRQARRAQQPAKDPSVALEQRRNALAKGRGVQRGRVNEQLDELEFLLDTGEWPPRACARLGWTIRGAIRAATRSGRHDLARHLYPHEDQTS